jgi:hypothetical protein
MENSHSNKVINKNNINSKIIFYLGVKQDFVFLNFY